MKLKKKYFIFCEKCHSKATELNPKVQKTTSNEKNEKIEKNISKLFEKIPDDKTESEDVFVEDHGNLETSSYKNIVSNEMPTDVPAYPFVRKDELLMHENDQLKREKKELEIEIQKLKEALEKNLESKK